MVKTVLRIRCTTAMSDGKSVRCSDRDMTMTLARRRSETVDGYSRGSGRAPVHKVWPVLRCTSIAKYWEQASYIQCTTRSRIPVQFDERRRSFVPRTVSRWMCYYAQER